MNKTKTSELLKQELEVYYNHYATEYQQAHYSKTNRYSPLQFRQSYIEEMIDNEGLPSGARVLDVGCGPGELALNLLRKGFNVSAVDISQSMVDTAAQIVKENGFPEWNEVTVGDIENLEFETLLAQRDADLACVVAQPTAVELHCCSLADGLLPNAERWRPRPD